ncbi:hypothetical protein EMCRGX_G000391 [Ephydatia muelleri]
MATPYSNEQDDLPDALSAWTHQAVYKNSTNEGCNEQVLHDKVALASWIEDLVLQQGAAAKQVGLHMK